MWVIQVVGMYLGEERRLVMDLKDAKIWEDEDEARRECLELARRGVPSTLTKYPSRNWVIALPGGLYYAGRNDEQGLVFCSMSKGAKIYSSEEAADDIIRSWSYKRGAYACARSKERKVG